MTRVATLTFIGYSGYYYIIPNEKIIKIQGLDVLSFIDQSLC